MSRINLLPRKALTESGGSAMVIARSEPRLRSGLVERHGSIEGGDVLRHFVRSILTSFEKSL